MVAVSPESQQGPRATPAPRTADVPGPARGGSARGGSQRGSGQRGTSGGQRGGSDSGPEPAPSPTRPEPPAGSAGRMIVCGNDPLTHRLALELIHLYGERVTLIIPDAAAGHGPQLTALAAINAENDQVRVIPNRQPDENTLLGAGVADAQALALVLDDDAAVVQSALLARGLNPDLRLVIRVFNQRLGKRLGRLLELGGNGSAAVLSASDMAAPALVAAALPDRVQVVPARGATLSATQRDEVEDDGRGIRLALLTEADSNLLPPDTPPAGRHDVTVVRLRHDTGPEPRPRRARLTDVLLGVFSRRLRIAALVVLGLVALLTLATWQFTDTSPLRSLLLVLLDFTAAGNPATDPGDSSARQVLQLLTIFTGVVFLGLVVTLVLENLGTLGSNPRQRRVPRTLSGHVVLVGASKVAIRVMQRLHEMRVPVVLVARQNDTAGIAEAHARNIPVVSGEFARYDVYQAARVGRADALMALTSDDSFNLEAVLYAREHRPDLRAVLRLFDDQYATTVYRTLRLAHPTARTRSRSVSFLAAPSFAAAMMGRQVLASIPIKRQVLLVAELRVQRLPDGQLPSAFREHAWRVVAGYDERGTLRWNPSLDAPLTERQRVIVVATREGLGLLLQRSADAGAGVGAGAGAGGGSTGTGAGAAQAQDLPTSPRAEPSAPFPSPEELEEDSYRVGRRRSARGEDSSSLRTATGAPDGHGSGSWDVGALAPDPTPPLGTPSPRRRSD